MPYRTLEVEEIARYLHLSRADIEHLVKHQDIPYERRRERLVFRKVAVDAWASQRILGLQGKRLTEYHQRSSLDTKPFLAHEAIMPDLIQPAFINPELAAKTKASVLREMAALAEATGRVPDSGALLRALEAREALSSTGLPGGLALLHPRCPDTYLFESPFIVLGRTPQDIFFGAPDGLPTRLFFLLGCPDDRFHLHTLARVCMMIHKTPLFAALQNASDAEAMHRCILDSEQQILKPPSASGASKR
jgi:excisionase family DNA binding protein